MADEEKGSSAIDETSIAPSRPGHVRQDSLEKHLQTRPDAQELKDKHILLNTTAAPSLQAAAHDLERQKATDSLKKGLERRPHREDLIERASSLPAASTVLLLQNVGRRIANKMPLGNILPDSNAAPGIVGHQKELEKHMRADSLNEKIAHRPSPAELVKEGVLLEDPTSPTKEESDADKLYEERIEDEYAKREGGA
ncbi:MAG: hypothetical protein M1818_001313 [Claussenomyces sp. TS43310]|nr:MAG: hypothetical protein M1818_001313 [Claussenomyces sp. TS43310]